MKRLDKGRFLVIILAALVAALACASAAAPRTAAAEEYYDAQLNAGLWNNEPYSYSLFKSADQSPANARQLLEEALKHSPDFPPAYFKLSAESLSLSPENTYKTLNYAYLGMRSYGRSFWWSASLWGLLYYGLFTAFWLSVAVVVFMRLPLEIDRIRHDLKESRRTLWLLAFMFALSIFGPLCFLAGALMLLGIYMNKADKAVLYITLFVIAISPPVINTMNRYSYISGPELRAIVAVNESRGNNDALDALAYREDFPSRFAYAMALKRVGLYREAMQVLKGLRAETDDPRVLVNLANCFVAIGDLDTARDLYTEANEVSPSVKAVYNLSQVYREKFDYPNGDKYYRRAQELDSENVERFSDIAARHPNRLVIDETLTDEELWRFGEQYARLSFNPFTVPPPAMVFVALITAIAFIYADRTAKHRAYRCTKCNVTLCGRCAKDITWGTMCQKCYDSTVKLGQEDAKERVSRLLSIYDHQSRRRNMLRYLSFAPPGIVQIYAGKVLMGFLFLTAFMFPLAVMVMDPLFSTGLFGFSHSWMRVPFMLFMLILYLVSNAIARRRIEDGWL